MIGWLLRPIRRRRIWREPLPAHWEDFLHEHFGHWRWLTPPERTIVGRIARVLLREKYWEGCAGLTLDESMKLLIAAQAALLLLGMQHDYFRNVSTILVYPAGYLAGPQRDGLTVSAGLPVQGQAHFRGPIILSWRDVAHGAAVADDGRNLVLHEFAHKLDMMDGLVDGTPVMRDRTQLDAWVRTMTEHYDLLRTNGSPVLNSYGATNPAEFFAVATEAFFEQPIILQQVHPELYDVLAGYFQQDTAERLRRYRAASA